MTPEKRNHLMPTTPYADVESWTLTALNVRDVGWILRRQWPVVASTALVFAGLAIAAFFALTPRYEARSEVLIEPPKHRVLSQEDRSLDNPLLDSSVVDSQIPLIVSNRNLANVIAQEHLTEDTEFAYPEERITRDPDSRSDDPNRIDQQLTPLITRLVDHLNVSRVGKSNVVAIRVISRDPQKAAKLADVIAEDYVADQVASRVRVTQQAATLFTDRIDALRAQVRISENALASYRQHNGMTTTSDEKITISDQQLGNLNERLAFASSDTALKLAKYNQAVQFQRGAGDLSTLPEIVLSPAMIQLRNQLTEIQRQEADASSIYGNAYPDVIKLKAQKLVLSKALAGEVGRLTAMLRNDYVVAQVREAALQKQVGSLIAPVGVAPDAGVELRELQRTNLANKALFENFLARAKLTQEESTFEAPDSRLISPALIPAKPVSPKLQILLPIGIGIGIALGLLGALIRDKISPEIRRSYKARFFITPQAAK